MPETSMTAGFYHIPNKTVGNQFPLFPSSNGQLDDGGDRPPVTLAVGDQIEVRRAPVLDEGRARIPAGAAVHLLDIAPALAAGGDQVALLPRLLRGEPHLVGGAVDAAEGTAQLGEGPGARAEVAGQAAAAVLDDVDESGRAAAERADPERPRVLRKVIARGCEQRLERGAQARAGDKRERAGAEAGDALRARTDAPARRQQGCGAHGATVPRRRERLQRRRQSGL